MNISQIELFKQEVISASANKEFIHHKWFVKYHLEIVQKISKELCEIHPEADKCLVELLVWLHDYGKICDFENQYTVTRKKGKEKMAELGFTEPEIEKAISFVEIMDKKEGLEKAPIEVQIISSADGAAHLIGPFFPIYWYENPSKSVDELLQSNNKKAIKDWENKIVLPEVKKAFLKRHKFVLENSCGEIPEKIILGK